MGDDLSNVLNVEAGTFASSIYQSLFGSGSQKYRPVFQLVLFSAHACFGDEFRSYIIFNCCILAVTGMLFSVLAYHLSGFSTVTTAVLCILLLVSRFAYYQVWQLTGLLEGLALFEFLAMLYCLLRAANTRSLWWVAASLVLFLLLIHTHERYLVVGPFLLAAVAVVPLGDRVRAFGRTALASLACLAIAVNIVVKKLLLNLPFFIGTGGTAISAAPSRIVSFAFSGLVNMIGFNDGPTYLSALDIREAGSVGVVLGLGMTGAVSAVLALAYWSRRARGLRNPCSTFWIPPGLFILLLGGLLLGASVTIRQEYRWLYAPYAVVLLALAWLFGQIARTRWLPTLPAIALAAAGLSVDGFYRQHIQNLFFVDGLRVAESARHIIVGRHAKDIDGKQVVVLTVQPRSVCDWYFLRGSFLEHYLPGRSYAYYCGISIGDVGPRLADSQSLLVFTVDPEKQSVVDVTESVQASIEAQSALEDASKIDFLREFPNGQISDPRHVETGPGSGAFLVDWPAKGGSEETIMVASGFYYSYFGVPIRSSDHLVFSVGLAYPSRDRAKAYVEIEGARGGRSRIFEKDLVPPQGGTLSMTHHAIDLGSYDRQSVDIAFGAEILPGGHPAGHWIAFGSPRIAVPRDQIVKKHFLASFQEGRINNDRPVATPAGVGAFIATWPSDSDIRRTLTVVTGFQYSFSNLSFQPEDALAFDVAMVYPSAFPARAYVEVRLEGQTNIRIYEESIQPPTDTRHSFARRLVELGDYAGASRTLTFGVETPQGDPAGHWVAFASPRILASR